MSLLNSFSNNILLSNLIKIRCIAIIKWEHIQKFLLNLREMKSETVRRLRMYRRIFKRIFNKRTIR